MIENKEMIEKETRDSRGGGGVWRTGGEGRKKEEKEVEKRRGNNVLGTEKGRREKEVDKRRGNDILGMEEGRR